MAAFLDLDGFITLWDGPPLNAAQQELVPTLLTVAANWILARASTLPLSDPGGQLVSFEVTATALRYGKYAALSSFHRATGHRIDAGTLANPETALDFTDRHKQILGIALRSAPIGQFYDNDFSDPTFSGWPTSSCGNPPNYGGNNSNPWLYDQ